MSKSNTWNPNKYGKDASFVFNLASELISLLDVKKDERILDLGCGEGTLALDIKKLGADVLGIDSSDNMVNATKEKGIEAEKIDILSLNFENEFDKVFSNATLHWVKDRKKAIKNIYKVLKPKGTFVAEFGGEGNIKSLVDAMTEVFKANPSWGKINIPWVFSNDIEYKKLLENNGFEVKYIELIPRPTKINSISNWLDIFANGITKNLILEEKDKFKNKVNDILKEKIYSKADGWVADYVRLRVVAVKL